MVAKCIVEFLGRYRAPEVILVQPEYGMAIDVWSIGLLILMKRQSFYRCIFAELLQIEKVLCNNTIFMPPKRSIPRQPLFPGSYCYPLSPKKQIGNSILKIQQK